MPDDYVIVKVQRATAERMLEAAPPIREMGPQALDFHDALVRALAEGDDCRTSS
jgi:hypothetical protein